MCEHEAAWDLYGNQKVRAKRLLVEQLCVENSKETQRLKTDFASRLNKWYLRMTASVEISGKYLCKCAGSVSSLRKKSHLGGRETHPSWALTRRRFLFFIFLLCLLWFTPTETVMCSSRVHPEFEGVCSPRCSGDRIKRQPFPCSKAICTTCWGRNWARRPQIRT